MDKNVNADKLNSKQVYENLRPYLTPEARFVVGVSGGPDSLALLHLLPQLIEPDQLIVAHLNHSLRSEADEEMQFVLTTAVSWGVACVVDKVDVAALAADTGCSLEEAGRIARYRFLADVAAAEAADFIIVAHHADDQAETVLMNLIRGTGVAGLRGMQLASPLLGRPEFTLIRPLLTVSRAQIEAYCEAHQLQPVQDASNEDIRFFRNRIRQELLPYLSQYNPQIKTHLQQLAEITTADYALMDEWFSAFWHSVFVEEGEGWLTLTRARWLELPLSHKRLALRRAVQSLRPFQTDISFRSIELARELIERQQTGAQIDLAGNVHLQVGYHHIVFWQEGAVLPQPLVPQLSPDTTLLLPIPGQAALDGGWILQTAVYNGPLSEIENNHNPWLAYCDVGALDQFEVRSRQPGERFQPLGLDGRSAKLKEVMINRKMAQAYRSNWPIIATAEHLVWLVGHHQDERTRVKPTTHRIIQISCRRKHEAS